MEEDINELPREDEVRAPKKRGRKPKADASEKSPKPRGRRKKADAPEAEFEPRQDAAVSSDSAGNFSEGSPEKTSEPESTEGVRSDAESASAENFEPEGESEAEIFVHRERGDDFAVSGGYDDVPEYFSTSEDDLVHDAYRSSDDDFQRDSSEEEPRDEYPDDYSKPDFAESEDRARDSREDFRNRKNFQQNRNRSQNSRWQNNGKNFSRNSGGNKNYQNRNSQQNSRWQGGKNFGGVRSNGKNFQNPQKAQNNQQRLQQQKNQQSARRKSRWPHLAAGEGELMNPADLPDWEVLKSEELLNEYVAAYLGDKAALENISIRASQSGASEVSAEKISEDLSEKNSEGETPVEEAAPSEEKMISVVGDWQVGCPVEIPESNKGEDLPGGEPRKFLPDGFFDSKEWDFNTLAALEIKDLQEAFDSNSISYRKGQSRSQMYREFFSAARARGKLLRFTGILDVFEGEQGGAVCYASDSYALKSECVYVPKMFIDKYALQRGHEVRVTAIPPRENAQDNCPIAVRVESVMGLSPDAVRDLVPFTDLTPYYPTRRMIMEADSQCGWDNLSMRVVDLLTPIGLGQRALIVAPPRTGKTVLLQGMAKSIRRNTPEAKLIVLLVDERPEEVTDFRRHVDAEVVASTFDADAFSHVHAAEMVISMARRMVETGRDVVILLDSITRLARAYNALMPNGGRTMSGGIEVSALQKPKRFFGSARNIEGGGSLTIVGTALIETGSKMDDVIFEEFKGTGNLELHLDRSLSDKRIFPSINMEKSGTRKEELLYHPDELPKIYALRRAMKGVASSEAMELLLQRLKKVKTNIEFLMGLNR